MYTNACITFLLFAPILFSKNSLVLIGRHQISIQILVSYAYEINLCPPRLVFLLTH